MASPLFWHRVLQGFPEMTCFVWKTRSQPKQSNWKQHPCAKWWVSHWISILENIGAGECFLNLTPGCAQGKSIFQEEWVWQMWLMRHCWGWWNIVWDRWRSRRVPQKGALTRGEIKTSPPCSQVRPQALKEKGKPLQHFTPIFSRIQTGFGIGFGIGFRNSPGLVLFAVSWAPQTSLSCLTLLLDYCGFCSGSRLFTRGRMFVNFLISTGLFFLSLCSSSESSGDVCACRPTPSLGVIPRSCTL